MELTKDRKRELLLRPLKMGLLLHRGGYLGEVEFLALELATVRQLQEEGIEPRELGENHRHRGEVGPPPPRAGQG